MMAGLFEPSDGRMTLDGEVIRGTDRRRGMVFQQDAVFPWMTLAKNISYGPRLRGASRKEQAEIEARWIELVGLKGFENRWPRELSGGMRKRVDIGRVYANDPDVLLMDEPFGALDEITRDRLNDELLSLWRRTGTTILFITHSIMEAVYLGQRVLVLGSRPGRVIALKDLRDAKTPDNRCRREDPAIVSAMTEMRNMLEAA